MAHSRAQDDDATIAGFLEGQAEAVGRVDGWIAGAASPFRRRLGADWPDLLQEARIEILRLLRRSAWRGESRLKTYVWQVVAHTCLDALRRQKRRPPMEPMEPEAPLPSNDPSPLDRAMGADAQRRLLMALAAVPEDCRELWGLILAGMTYQQIGVRLGVAEGALRVRAHRCRKRAIEALRGNEPGQRAAEG